MRKLRFQIHHGGCIQKLQSFHKIVNSFTHIRKHVREPHMHEGRLQHLTIMLPELT